MDTISIGKILLVSFPEELLTVVITLAAAGYKDALNLKKQQSLLKLMLTALLMTISSSAAGVMIQSNTMKFLVLTVLFYLIILFSYRGKPLAFLGGYIVSAIVIIISNAVFLSLLVKLFDLQISQYTSDSTGLFLLTLPDRILQIIAIYILCRVRNIDLRIEKLSFLEKILSFAFIAMIVSCMFFVEDGYKNVDRSLRTILVLTINVCAIVIFSFWLIWNLFKLKKKLFVKENMYNVELHHLKQLLEEGQNDYAIELIDLTLKERGYYK